MNTKGRSLIPVPVFIFPFAVPNKNNETMSLLSSLAPQAEEWEIEKETSLLNVSYDVLYRPFSTLSPGEKTKCLLAALFLHGDKYLLIDEPLNYLDIEARVQIESLLVSSSPTMIFVEHDEAFRTKVATEVISLQEA